MDKIARKDKAMKKRIVIGLLFIIIVQTIGLYSNSASAKNGEWSSGPAANKISAESAIVMDINSGTILYEKNIHDKHYPASITKIMTTLLCLENASLTDTVTFSREAVYSIEPGSSNISVVPNEQITMENCLYGIMLMSANEVCNGVAEHIAGDIDGFVDMMNDKAGELGCKNTHFANPNGLFNKKHYTSAYDMGLISCAAMKNSMFRKVAGTELYTIPATNIKEERHLYHKHEMFHSVNYHYKYDYCIGGKTGYTEIARYTLVTFAKKDDLELVCVIMRANNSPKVEPNEYTDTTKLLNYAFDKYESHPIESKIGNYDSEVKYSLFSKYNSIFDENNSPIYIEENANIILPKGADITNAEKKIEYYDEPVVNGSISEIGKITYTYKGKTAGSAKVLYDSDKAVTAELNREVTEYVDELDKEITKKNEETNNNYLNGIQTEDERGSDEGIKKKGIVFGPIQIIAMIVVSVLLCFVIIGLMYRARLRKKYFGSYGSLKKRSRSRSRYLKKRYKW